MTSLIRFLPLCALLLATPALQASAEDATTDRAAQPSAVYELFTSQGCSSCPPSNAQIGTLAEKPGTLALTYGVTYWDYLGWKDTFASPEFTQRQHDYVKALGGRNAYTPQIVVNGEDHGPRVRTFDAPARTLDADIVLSGNADALRADGAGQAALVTYMPGEHSVPVARGENGGKTLTLTNVVTDVEIVTLPHSFTPADGRAYAVLKHGADMQVTSAAVWPPLKG